MSYCELSLHSIPRCVYIHSDRVRSVFNCCAQYMYVRGEKRKHHSPASEYPQRIDKNKVQRLIAKQNKDSKYVGK